MGIEEPWWREDNPRNAGNGRAGWWERGRACDNIKKKSIKILGGKRSPRESLWVENLRSNNKNGLQDGTTLTTVARKR